MQGNLLSPGLIDIQINGAWRVDFSELDVQAGEEGEKKYIKGLERVARRLAQYGTTSFVPTIITQHQELYSKVSPKIFCYMWLLTLSSFFDFFARAPLLAPPIS